MVCRTRRDDAQLVRAGRTKDAQWYLGRGPGRGAWWCDEAKCTSALRVETLTRALRVSLSVGDVVMLGELVNAPRE